MTDASNDEFIVEMEQVFGLEGYARWFKLLEIIGKQMDKSQRCSVAYPWSTWQTLLKGKRKKLETFFKHLENQQRIFLKQSENVLEIGVPNLLKFRDEYSRKSGHTQDRSRDNVAPETDTETKKENNKSTAVATSTSKTEQNRIQNRFSQNYGMRAIKNILSGN